MKQLTIIGHIGADATTNLVQNEEVVRFTVAVNERRNQQDATTWVTVFTRQTSLAPYLLRGTQVYVQGNVKFGVYNRGDGSIRPDISIGASMIQLLGSKPDNAGQAQPATQPAPAAQPQQRSAQPIPASQVPPPARQQGSRLQTTPPMGMQPTEEDDSLPF